MTTTLKPFWNQDSAKLFLGDSIEIMNKLPEKSVDLIFADPPYNLSNGGYSVHSGKRVSVNKGDWDVSAGPEEDFKFHYDWISACRRILKDSGSLWISGTYHSIYACGYALQLQGWRILNEISWFKPNAAPNVGCRMFTASHETLIWASKSPSSKHTFNYQDMKMSPFPKDILKNFQKQMRSVWSITTPASAEKRHGKHPTQKPEALLDRVIRASSNPGDVVLDPFCGSATTGVVAVRHHRNFIGIDMDSNYLDNIAIPRLTDGINEIK